MLQAPARGAAPAYRAAPPPYWAGDVSRQVAVSILEADGRGGCFLLRVSSAAHCPPATHDGVKMLTAPYTISVLADTMPTRVRHFRLFSSKRGYFVEGEVNGFDSFKTVEDLVAHKMGRLVTNAADPDDYVVLRVPAILHSAVRTCPPSRPTIYDTVTDEPGPGIPSTLQVRHNDGQSAHSWNQRLTHESDLTGRHGKGVNHATFVTDHQPPSAPQSAATPHATPSPGSPNMFEMFSSAVSVTHSDTEQHRTPSPPPEPSILDDDVLTFLAGDTDAKALSRRRSVKFGVKPTGARK
eukprot:m.423011 g.423011  ORF g.423011 m.423011 type:complete len:296 (+) comp39532_c0_seq1:72-959(+)